jgi:hypothetical protein
MPKQALLIAGSARLDDLDNGQRLLAGDGSIAALAAAPFVPCQLWARVGNDYPEQCRQLLQQRGIDLAGLIGSEQASNCRQVTGDVSTRHGPDLPEEEPSDPSQLGGCLVIGLDAADHRRAQTALAKLPGKRLQIRAIAQANEAQLREAANGCDLLIARSHQACQALQQPDPLQAAMILAEAGATAVALSAGSLGGLLLYKNKACTWPTEPIIPKEASGAFAAFAGCLAGFLVDHSKLDFRGLKRGLLFASSLATATLKDLSSKRLLALDRSDYQDLFNRLRRHGKA